MIFNLSNLSLFERQVESDGALDFKKGEITLTDLAQSESSLAGAKANLIKAKTELFVLKQILRELLEKKHSRCLKILMKNFFDLPNTLDALLELAEFK